MLKTPPWIRAGLSRKAWVKQRAKEQFEMFWERNPLFRYLRSEVQPQTAMAEIEAKYYKDPEKMKKAMVDHLLKQTE